MVGGRHQDISPTSFQRLCAGDNTSRWRNSGHLALRLHTQAVREESTTLAGRLLKRHLVNFTTRHTCHHPLHDLDRGRAHGRGGAVTPDRALLQPSRWDTAPAKGHQYLLCEEKEKGLEPSWGYHRSMNGLLVCHGFDNLHQILRCLLGR